VEHLIHWKVTTRALIDELALKPREALLALRVAVSGGDVSPPLFESMYLVGRERTVARLARWIEHGGRYLLSQESLARTHYRFGK